MTYEQALKVVQRFQREWHHKTLESALDQMSRNQLLTSREQNAYNIVTAKQNG